MSAPDTTYSFSEIYIANSLKWLQDVLRLGNLLCIIIIINLMLP